MSKENDALMSLSKEGTNMETQESYSADGTTAFTRADCDAAVGKAATLHFTGRIVEAGESTVGPFVKFELDDRWGFPPGTRFVVDLDALEVE